ncbi:hypothetical protein ACP70R_033059 [Stipagrostis hirtigluma subsp. patula]
MASRGLGGYDYGAGSGAGGKIRRRPPSRAAASPYARPAPAPAPPSASSQGSQGGGWLSRLIAAGASRFLPSVFRKTPPQLAAPPPPPQLAAPPPPPEPLHAPPSRWEPENDLLPPRSEPLDAPPSPPPPPLEDDLPEGEENGGAIAKNLGTQNPENSARDVEDDTLRNSDDHGAMDLEDLLKRRTFTRSEFDYLSELLWSRTVGSNSLKQEDGNIRQKHVSEKEDGLRHSNLPVDFSIRTYRVADQGASPAEVAKAYMGSKSSKGSPLRLRLHDPSTLPIRSMEDNTIQKAKPPTIPLLQGSRFHTSNVSDRLESNMATPNRSAIYKMSSSPYFKSAGSSKDLFSTGSSSYQIPGSVHTFGRQVLKRKSTALNQEIVSVGPIRKMRQRYNRTSPLLDTRPGYRGYLGGHGTKLDEDSEQSRQTQKRRCLDNAAIGGLDSKAHANSFGQAPVQSTEMAAKILKQLDTLVPPQKERTSDIKQKKVNAMDVEDPISHKKDLSALSNNLESSSSGVKEHALLNGINGTVKFTPAAVAEANADATSNGPAALTSNSISQITSPKDSVQMDNCNGSRKIAAHRSNDETEKKQSLIPEHTDKSSNATNKDKPPTFSLRSNAPSNLVLSSDVGSQMSINSNGFTFPVPSVFGAQSQAPPTPTLASPPKLPVEKQQPSVISNCSVTSAETVPRIIKSVSEGSVAEKCDKKSSTDDQPMSSKTSGEVASFTCNPVFVNSKSRTLRNGLDHTSNSMVSSVPTANGSTDAASKQSSSIGGSFTFSSTLSSTGTGSLSVASSGAGSVVAPFNFSPQFGTASSLTAQDKSKAVSSSTPFSFSPQFSTVSSASQGAQSGNSNSAFMQSSVSSLNFKSSEKSNCGSSQSFANSPAASSPFGCSPFSSSSLFSSGAGSSSTSVVATATLSSPATCSPFGSTPAFSSPIFGSNLTATAPSSFGLPNTGSATSPFGSTSTTVFSFTSATPSIPSPSPATPIFATASPTVVSTDHINGGNMVADKNSSPVPFSSASPFGIPSSSPSTPAFSSPATQFASATSASPDIFQFGQHNQASSGGFSMGTGGGNDKSGRRIIKVKRRK